MCNEQRFRELVDYVLAKQPNAAPVVSQQYPHGDKFPNQLLLNHIDVVVRYCDENQCIVISANGLVFSGYTEGHFGALACLEGTKEDADLPIKDLMQRSLQKVYCPAWEAATPADFDRHNVSSAGFFPEMPSETAKKH